MYIKQNILTFSLYFLVTYTVVKLFNDPSQAILIWPAVGIGIVTALVWGYRVLPALYLSQLALSLVLYNHDISNYDFKVFAIDNVFVLIGLIRCYLGAYLIKSIIGYPNSLISNRAIFYLFALIGPSITLITSVLNSSVKFIFGFLETSSLTSNFIDWWFGDLLGFIIFAPLTMVLISQPKSIWRPRLYTLALPVIITFTLILFISNKTQENDYTRIAEEFKIKNELIVTKINQKINWVSDFIDGSWAHFLLPGEKYKTIEHYFKSYDGNVNNISTIIWINDNKIEYYNASKDIPDNKYNAIRSLDIKQYIQQTKRNKLTNKTLYNEKIQSFINVFYYSKKNHEMSVVVVHDILSLLKSLLNEFNIKNIKIDLTINNNKASIIDTKELMHKNALAFNSNILFNNEKWKITFVPTVNYFNNKKSNSNSIIAKLGFLFTGLIGAMLLIITGKTTLTNIKVKERTLDLDTKVNRFINQKQQYFKLIEFHPIVLWRQDIARNQTTYVSEKVESIYGYPVSQWLGDKEFWFNHIHHDDLEMVKSIINKSINDRSPFELEYRFIKSDSSIAWVKDVVNFNKDKNNNLQLVGLMIDITETKEAQKDKSISESKYKTLFKHASDPIIIIDLDNKVFRDYNDKAVDLFGLDQIIGEVTIAEFSPIKQPDGSISTNRLKNYYKQLNQNGHCRFEWVMNEKTHKNIICKIKIVKLLVENSNLAIVDINDITEKRLHEKKINQLAYYDTLTSLPNRDYFYSKFSYFHNKAIENQKYGCVIYLDLDRFKILNDSLGHQAGDTLLKMVSKRIRLASKKSDFCARLGGDEFIILTKKLENSIESTLESNLVKSELILEALNEPYQLDDYEHYITPSIGLSVYPSGDASIDQIIHQADIAMYASKEKGKNTITVYQDKMVKLVGKRLKIEKAIRQAFDNNEFRLFYQPQFNSNRKVVSAEALLRWHKLEELSITTEELISLIEQIGLIHELGYWVFDQACQQLENWQKNDHTIGSIAINVSSKQFHRKLFVEQIKSVINSYDISPSQITIELTEAVIVEDVVTLINKLNELQSYGVKISLDDFGTGYSSLAYLKHLPINQLKIDQLFVHDLSKEESSQHIIKTIIDLARLMKIDLIVEGIELEEQFSILKDLGCEYFQGFYFSKALSAEQLIKIKHTH